MRRVEGLEKGLLITFEGIEGSGKTTQIKKLSRWFRARGLAVVETREPGGTPLANQIRSLLLDSGTRGMTPSMELFLYETARRDHVDEAIRPALESGKIVLCDRFTDATLAYQGYGRGLSLKMIEALNEIATGGIHPNLTFLFDLPVSKGLKRARQRNKKLDRLERESKNFHEKVRQGYLTLARKEKRKFRIIHAERTPNEIFAELCREMEGFV